MRKRRREGDREGQGKGGGRREGEEGDQNTNCFVQLHTCTIQHEISFPRQRNGIEIVHKRLYATHHCPLRCVGGIQSCVYNLNSIPLSGERDFVWYGTCMQLYKAVCILIHPLLPLSFHPPSPVPLCPLPSSSSQVSPTPPSQTLVFW